MSSKQLATNLTICDNLFKQGSGLMFRFPKKPFAYIFPFKKPVNSAITMWFVFYSIDIVFLDDKGVVVEIVENLKPFRNYFPRNYFSTFIEFPKNTISKNNIKVGSSLLWSSKSVDLTY